MEEVHADPNQPFDPEAQYAPCCHPSNMPPGSIARETWEQHRAQLAAALNAATLASQELAAELNRQQELRAQEAANGN